MTHRIVAGIGALALVCAAAGPASADGAEHGVYVEEYDAYEHLDAADNFCGDWAATFHEVRSGEYKLVAAPGGRDQGELHVNGAIDGLVELIPDDAALPTYAGTFREKVNGVVTAFTDEGDIERVAQFRLRSTLRGTDGSTLDLRLWGKFTMNAIGDVVVDRGGLTCE